MRLFSANRALSGSLFSANRALSGSLFSANRALSGSLFNFSRRFHFIRKNILNFLFTHLDI